jgi:hypothetical protein
MKIPCVENKCILYPVCKHKSYIECKDLGSYFDFEMAKRKLINGNKRHTMWKYMEVWILKINPELPSLTQFRKYDEKDLYISVAPYKPEIMKNLRIRKVFISDGYSTNTLHQR